MMDENMTENKGSVFCDCVVCHQMSSDDVADFNDFIATRLSCCGEQRGV